MELVLFALEMIEKPAHARKFSLAFNHQAPVVWSELCPGDIEGNLHLLGKALQFCVERAVFWLGPGLDCALI